MLFPIKRRWNWNAGDLRPQFQSIASGLSLLVPMWDVGGDAVNLIDGRSFLRRSGQEWTEGPTGSQSTRTAGTHDHFYTDTAYQVAHGGQDWTIFSFANPIGTITGGTNNTGALFYQRRGSSAEQWGLLIGYNATGTTEVAEAFTPFIQNRAAATAGAQVNNVVDGQWHAWGGRRLGSTLTAWVDGEQRASDVAIGGTLNASNMTCQIGGINFSGWGINGSISIVAVWPRGLSDQELVTLAADWVGLIEPRPSQVFLRVPLGGAPGGGEITTVEQTEGLFLPDQRHSGRSARRHEAVQVADARLGKVAPSHRDSLLLEIARRRAILASRQDTASLPDRRRSAATSTGTDSLFLDDRRRSGRAATRAIALLLGEETRRSIEARRPDDPVLISDQDGRSAGLARSFTDAELLGEIDRRDRSSRHRDTPLVGDADHRARSSLQRDHLALDDAAASYLRHLVVAREALGLSDRDARAITRLERAGLELGDEARRALAAFVLDTLATPDAASLSRARVLALALADGLELVDHSARDRSSLDRSGVMLGEADRREIASRTLDLLATPDQAGVHVERLLALADDLLLRDETTRAIGRVALEAMLLSESDRRAHDRRVLGGLLIADRDLVTQAVIQRIIARDHLQFDEMTRKAREAAMREGLELLDLQSLVRQLERLDGLALDDDAAVSSGRLFFVDVRDGMLLAELDYRDLKLRARDEAGLPDAAILAMELRLAEGFALTDTLAVGRGLTLIDRVAAIDIVSRGRGLQLGDGIELSESRATALWRLLLEQLELADRRTVTGPPPTTPDQALTWARLGAAKPMPARTLALEVMPGVARITRPVRAALAVADPMSARSTVREIVVIRARLARFH